jgi:hypothetical protein
MPRSRDEWNEELAAGMLEDLEEITGISIGEMLADEITAGDEGDFDTYPVYEEPTEDRPLDLNNPDGADTDEYFDVLFESIDVDADSEIDQYSEE